MSLGALFVSNQKSLKNRTTIYSLHAVSTTVIVLGIVGVLNFLSIRHPLKWDLTKNKVHTLSDHTVQLLKNLKQPLKITFYSKANQINEVKTLLENYQTLNPRIELEYVDPDLKPTQTRQAGIKKYRTLHLQVDKKSTRLEEITEEKVTNALIKLLNNQETCLYTLQGHGEKSFSSQDAQGYSAMKEALEAQAYELKEINLIHETQVPKNCNALLIMGPSKSFFAAEIQAIQNYLDQGGRAIIGLDFNLNGKESAPELLNLLQQWFIQSPLALMVDPFSKMLGVDASVAILGHFASEHPITQNFQSNCAFPFSRPLILSKDIPSTLQVKWLAKSHPKSWAITDLQSLKKGAVQFQKGKDLAGPLTAAVAIEGQLKKSESSKKTRMIVFGSSLFADNHYCRFAGNSDFFLNAVSWALENESFISIRSKEKEAGRIELSQKTGTFIFLITVLFIPLMIAAAGIIIWIRRKKL